MEYNHKGVRVLMHLHAHITPTAQTAVQHLVLSNHSPKVITAEIAYSVSTHACMTVQSNRV